MIASENQVSPRVEICFRLQKPKTIGLPAPGRRPIKKFSPRKTTKPTAAQS
jgi:hypothetical protein